jgi:trehalose synthase
MNRISAKKLRLDADLLLVHDVQPATLVQHRGGEGRWVWRCHFDCSHPQRRAWSFMRGFLNQYDAAIFSLPKFGRRLNIPQYVIHPSIDPLSDKNRDLPSRDVAAILHALAVRRDRPLLVQIGPFTRWSDPLGVVNAYRLVKKHYQVRLVLAGSAPDDRESLEVLADLHEAARHDEDITVLELPPDAHLQINALQRAATIVLQKSVREGFGLTVSEALWKGRPTVAGRVGGIVVQIDDGVSGWLVDSPKACAQACIEILRDSHEARERALRGKEHVRRHFLTPRLLRDWLALFNRLAGYDTSAELVTVAAEAA